MSAMEPTDVPGAPDEKAKHALGEKLNRPAKEPPTFPGHEIEKNDPPARRTSEEVDDL